MTSPNTSLKPLPPGVDRTNPHVLAIQIEHHRQALNHLQDTKLDKPSASLLRLVALIVTYSLGALGLVSPAFTAGVLKLLIP